MNVSFKGFCFLGSTLFILVCDLFICIYASLNFILNMSSFDNVKLLQFFIKCAFLY